MTCAFLLSCLPGGAVLYSGSKPSWGQPRTLRPCLRGDSSAPSVRRRMCGQSCFGTDKERRRGMSRGGAFTKNGEGGKAYALPKTRLGDGRPLPQMPMQAALRRGVIFSSIIPKHGRKINLLLLFSALLPHLGAVECAFHALLTVERLTFPAFLRIIGA